MKCCENSSMPTDQHAYIHIFQWATVCEIQDQGQNIMASSEAQLQTLQYANSPLIGNLVAVVPKSGNTVIIKSMVLTIENVQMVKKHLMNQMVVKGIIVYVKVWAIAQDIIYSSVKKSPPPPSSKKYGNKRGITQYFDMRTGQTWNYITSTWIKQVQTVKSIIVGTVLKWLHFIISWFGSYRPVRSKIKL